MMLTHHRIKITLLILIATLTACTSHPELETTRAAPTPVLATTRAVPTRDMPTPALETTLEVPAQASHSSGLDVISSANANQVVQIERLGTGWLPKEDDLTLFAWISKAPEIVVVSSAGFMIYDVATRQELRFIETPSRTRSFAVFSQSQTIATGGEDGTITLWDVATGQPLQTLRGAMSPVPHLVLSPDDQWLASADADVITLWDTATGQALKTFSLSGVQQMNFVTEQVLVVRNFETLKAWNVSTGQMVYESSYSSNDMFRLTTLTSLADDTLLAATFVTDTMELRNLTTNRVLPTLKGRPTYLVFSPDGKTLAIGDNEGVELRDTTTGEQLSSLTEPRLEGLALSPDNRTLVMTNWQGDVFLWAGGVSGLHQLNVDKPQRSIYPRQAAFTNDGRALAVQYADYDAHSRGPLVKVWDVASGQELVSFNNYNGTVYIGLTGSDRALTSSSILGKKTAKRGDAYTLWNLAANRALDPLPARRILAFSPDGKTLAVKESDAGNPYFPGIRDTFDSYLVDTTPLELWDITTGSLKYTLEQPTDEGSLVAFSPDGQLLAATTAYTVGSIYRVRLWDVAAGKEYLKLPTDQLSALAFAPGGETLVWTSWGKITFWDVAAGNARATFNLPIEGVFDMDFSPDGRLLALPDNHAHVIRLWDTVTKSERLTFNFGYPDEVLKIAFSPDGEILASGEGYGTIKLWHVATGEELATLRGPHVRMTGLAFLPDGTRLAVSLADGTVRLWGVP